MIIAPKWRALRLSVLTPVLPSASEHLAACEHSVKELIYALGHSGIIVQWLVGIDGPGKIAHQPRADHVIQLPECKGPAKTRNALLHLTQGEWVVPLDCHDTFNIAGMTELGQKLIGGPEDIGWYAANRMLADGEPELRSNNEDRIVGPGELTEALTKSSTLHPNAIIMRRSLLVALGGWPDMVAHEDLALSFILGERAKGLISIEVMSQRQ